MITNKYMVTVKISLKIFKEFNKTKIKLNYILKKYF